MIKNGYKWLWTSMLFAVPFLGGVNECEGPPPPPEPEYCFADDDCGAGARCNTDECLSPCAEGEACPAVCHGVCEPVEEPTLCLGDDECGADEFCNTDRCMAPPCGDEPAHLTVCLGTCEPRPICPPVLCDIYCPFGYAIGESGCETCGCEEPPPPPPICEPVLCTLYCEDGFETDELGCPVCSCAPPPTERNCGGFLGLTCADDEFCDWADDVPDCGAADHLGTCRPRPEVCPEVYGPVCGCDGAAYSNECFAHASGTDVVSHGTCGDDPVPLPL